MLKCICPKCGAKGSAYGDFTVCLSFDEYGYADPAHITELIEEQVECAHCRHKSTVESFVQECTNSTLSVDIIDNKDN